MFSERPRTKKWRVFTPAPPVRNCIISGAEGWDSKTLEDIDQSRLHLSRIKRCWLDISMCDPVEKSLGHLDVAGISDLRVALWRFSEQRLRLFAITWAARSISIIAWKRRISFCSRTLGKTSACCSAI